MVPGSAEIQNPSDPAPDQIPIQLIFDTKVGQRGRHTRLHSIAAALDASQGQDQSSGPCRLPSRLPCLAPPAGG